MRCERSTLPFRFGARRLDVDVAHALVFDVPVELRLGLMAVVRPDGVDAEGETLDDVVDEADRVRLGVLLVDAQRADPGGIVDCSVLEAPHLVAFRILQMQELDVDLHVVAGDLLLVAHARHRALVAARRQAVDAVPDEHVVDPVGGDREAVVAP